MISHVGTENQKAGRKGDEQQNYGDKQPLAERQDTERQFGHVLVFLVIHIQSSNRIPDESRYTFHNYRFFTQTCNIDIDGTVEHINFIVPYFGQNVFTGENTSLVLQEKQ